MTLTELKNRFKLFVPQAKASAVSDATLALLLNEGVTEVNLLTKLYKSHTDKTSTESKQTYQLSEDFQNCLSIDKGGVWVKNDDSKFFRMIPKTREWFDDHLENWFEASDAMPQYYFVDGDDLTFNVPFDQERTIRMYHVTKPGVMSNGTDYPWSGSSTELPSFKAMDNAIIAYAVREIQHALGKKGDYGIKDTEFQTKVRRGIRRVRRRPDYTSDHAAGMTFA